MTLVRVNGGRAEFALTKTEKREALRSVDPGAVYLVAWTGQWSTHIFAPTAADLARLTAETVTQCAQRVVSGSREGRLS